MIYSDLKEKKILVTGATRGIGKKIAMNLAEQGAHVVFNYRAGKEDIAQKFKKELESLGAVKATPILFDVTQEEQIKEAINAFVKEYGPISGLVNNAGISKDQIFFRLKKVDLDETLDTNLKGAMLVTSALSRSFLKAEDVSVVNMSSVVGLMGNASQVSYSASKAGLIGFTKSFAKEVASRNIRCNAICPGFIETEMTETLDEKVRKAYLSEIPLKRMGSVDDVAQLVSFLLSKASSYITGEVIKIDGGLYI
ncbi:MAG: beta-ketoacyl-ACP reductase [Epsilonproteobacteria bacterium]|nr:MAG: beta-ketoacyl-ACP reductase [Campylobacterota bacterium]RLA65024.1 MAG: beta-ketoacyl-ACP reductase [Campylobacterota bacterium]